MDAYAADPTSYGVQRSPYYDTDPVQFSYTPADMPQRPAVVRPERQSLASTILPSQTRIPLQNLIVMARPAMGIGFIPRLPAIDDKPLKASPPREDARTTDGN